MNIRKKMIDNVTNSDWTREELAVQLLEARYNRHKNCLEVQWLDKVIDVLRGEGEEGRGQDVLYQEFKEDLKALKLKYHE
jgi:hypothetical protein|tara:strand:+ start:120 stop:359 length:240 start_codon:yes stop_codon:yes gene_type:complete